jgi:hypothetical protein
MDNGPNTGFKRVHRQDEDDGDTPGAPQEPHNVAKVARDGDHVVMEADIEPGIRPPDAAAAVQGTAPPSNDIQA